MTSKISFFNIAKEDLRHRLWMLALSCLGSLLALPVAFLMTNSRFLEVLSYSANQNTEHRVLTAYCQFLTSTAVITEGCILFAGAIIVAVFGFRYLYSRRMVDLYHSLAVKRGRLFFASYLNGLLIWLIPMLLSMGLTLLFILANLIRLGYVGLFGTIAAAAAKMLLVFLLAFFTVYHFCLVCVMLCGNILNVFASLLVSGALVAAVYGIFYLFCESFLDTFVELSLTLDQVAWASPLVSPFLILMDRTKSLTAQSAYSSNILAHPMIFYAGCLLLLLFNLWAAYRLYQKRPSELAEHGIDNRYFQGFLRISASFLSAMLGMILFAQLMDSDAVGWMVFGGLLCGCFAFGVMDIILHMNFRSFLDHKLQMILTMAVSCLFLFVFSFDLTGYDTRLPDQSQVVSASVRINGYMDESQRLKIYDNGAVEYNMGDDNSMEYQDMGTLYPVLSRLNDNTFGEDSPYATRANVVLQLKNGRSFQRRYFVKEEDAQSVRSIIESKEYQSSNYPVCSGLWPAPAKLSVSSELNYSVNQVQDRERIQKILDAYAADFQEHYTMEELSGGLTVGNLSLNYPYYSNGDSMSTSSTYVDLQIKTNYQQTIRLLKEYFPELILESKELSIQALKLYPADLSYSGKQYPKEPSAAASEDTVMATHYDNDAIYITDADTIDSLLPILHLGSSYSSTFSSLERYHYVGDATTAEGNRIPCYMEISDLPFDLDALQ